VSDEGYTESALSEIKCTQLTQ